MLVFILLAAAGLLAACGGGSPAAVFAPASDALLAPLPASVHVITVDVATVRADLGLPADADVIDTAGFAPTADPARHALSEVGALALPYVGSAFASPLRQALDGRRIMAVASTGLVTVVRTAQPFGQIEASLRGAGYRRSGNQLLPPTGTGGPTTAARQAVAMPLVADHGDGLVVLDGRTAGQAAASPDGDARGLLGRLDGPVRSATGSCGAGIAASLGLPGHPGELLAITGPAPDAARFLRPGSPLRQSYDFGPPKAAGGAVRASYTDRTDTTESEPLLARLRETTFADVYRCP